MNLEQLLLVKLMEELAEVQQACSKAIRFSLDEKCEEASMTNAEYIREEFLDVLAVLHVLKENEILNIVSEQPCLASRVRRISQYMGYSRELGILE